MENEILESISFKERNKVKEFICYCIALSALLLSLLFCFTDNFNRLILAFITFGKNIVYYFISVFVPNTSIDAGVNLKEVIELKGGIDNYSILPVDFEVFKAEIQTYFYLFFDGKNYLDFFLSKSYVLINSLRFSIVFIPFIYLIRILFDNYLEEDSKRKNVDSKFYKSFLFFEKKILDPVVNFIKDFLHYLIYESRFYLILFICIFFFDINLFTVVLDVIGWMFYFSSSLNLLSIFEIVVCVLLDLGPFLLKVPLIIYLLIAYLIFDKIRKNKAFEHLQHFENYNKGFICSLGINTLILGAPGAGKTQMMTDMVLSTEEILRTRLLNILIEIKNEFPDFPFHKLEKEMDDLIKHHQIYNHFMAKDFISFKFYMMENTNDLYGYDFNRFKFDYDNGLYVENLYEALSDYAQANYLYSLKTPLSATNFAIRHDGKLVDRNHFKVWNYDYFKAKSNMIDYRFNSKIIDFNSFRINKKLNTEEKNSYKLDGGVVALTEVGKERRNQFYTNKLDRNDFKANQLNDGFNDYMKMKRHDCTIRNKPIFMLFADDQREESLNADLRDLFEYKITIHQQDASFQSSLFGFDNSLSIVILETIVAKIDEFNLKYDVVRSDKTLLKYLLNKVSYAINSYLTKRHNTFDFKMIEVDVDNGIDCKKQKYFLMKKKIYSRRYSTNCYSAFFEEKYMQSSSGFIDLKNFGFYKANIKELVSMNSYFIEDLNKIFNSGSVYNEASTNDVQYM